MKDENDNNNTEICTDNTVKQAIQTISVFKITFLKNFGTIISNLIVLYKSLELPNSNGGNINGRYKCSKIIRVAR